MQWDIKYSVGNKEIDEQHQGLMAIIAECRAMGLDEITRSILKLYKYTREHFTTEEQHMRDIGFPEVSGHIELHNKLLTDLTEFCEKPVNTASALNSFLEMLENWLDTHLLKHDHRYIVFAQAVESKNREKTI
ncbi:MAG: bacteriohemerythrin [Fibrobacterales bacterium]